MSEAHGHKNVKAKKEHICDFCNLNIKKGETYQRQVIFYEGTAVTWKNHKTCSELASELRWFDECEDGLTTDDFITSVKESYIDFMSEEHSEIYESIDFKYPSFEQQLQALKTRYLSTKQD